MARAVTVIDVCRSMGVEPTPGLTWSVGAMVREAWENQTGRLPFKDLRPKTNPEAGGTHCIAVYPADFRPAIERIIRLHETMAVAQMSLPLEGETDYG